MKKKLNMVGKDSLPILSFPITKKNRVNEKKKAEMITETEKRITAAHMLSLSKIKPDAPLLICGEHSKAFLILKELVKMTEKPFLLIGTEGMLKNSPLNWLNIEWEAEDSVDEPFCGNGKLTLKNGRSTKLVLAEALKKRSDYLPIICLGKGYYLDADSFELINGLDSYILLSGPVLDQGVKEIGGGLKSTELLVKMSYIIVSSISAKSTNDLISILPQFEERKVSDNTALNLHRDAPGMDMEKVHHRTGISLQLSQVRNMETRPVLTQDDFREALQNNNRAFAYNALINHIWIV